MDFRETVLEEKLIPRALLQDSEPSSAGNAISDVFLVNLSRFKAQEKRVETRGESRGSEILMLDGSIFSEPNY